MATSSTTPQPPWLDTLELYAESEKKCGELALPSGRVVACDPLVSLDDSPHLGKEVPAGTYPVLLGKLDGDTAWARIEFTATPTASWERAGSQSVDSGTSCFADSGGRDREVTRQQTRMDAVFAAVATRGVDPADPDAWYDAVDEEKEKLGEDTFLEQVRSGEPIDLGEGAGLIAFSSGAGDGSYTSWWGLDAEGAVCTLLTDFGLMDEDDDDLGSDDLGSDDLDDADFSALFAALGKTKTEDAPEQKQGPAPAYLRAEAFVKRLIADGLLELEEGAEEDDVAEAVLPILDTRSPDPTTLAEALFEARGVEELYASDEDLLERL